MVYPLIFLLNIPILSNNAFFVAFILIIFIVPRVVNKIFENGLAYRRGKDAIYNHELVYSNNIPQLRKNIIINSILNGVFFVYLLSYFIALFALGSDRALEYIVFGLFTLFCGIGTFKNIRLYLKVKNLTQIDEDTIDLFYDENQLPYYEEYVEARKSNSYDDLCRDLENPSKALKIIDIVFAIASIILGCILLGLWLPIFLFDRIGEFIVLAMVLYASMATFFGIKDLIVSIRESK